MNNTDPGFSLCWFQRKCPVLALHPCLWSLLTNTVLYVTVTHERYNSTQLCPLGRSFGARAEVATIEQTTLCDVTNSKSTKQHLNRTFHRRLFPVLPYLSPDKAPCWEQQCCKNNNTRLTLAMAFLYRMVACWIRLCILILPSPQGTTTRVLPKHTVTFIFARYSQRLHGDALEVLNSSGKTSEPRQHCLRPGKSGLNPHVALLRWDWTGLEHLFGAFSLVSPRVALKWPWAGLPTRSHWLTAVLFQSVLLVDPIPTVCFSL